MSEYKKCDGCGSKYKDDDCHYCTTVVIEKDDLPHGILPPTNITPREWKEALKAYHASDKKDKRMILFGLDPSIETRAQYIEFPGKSAREFKAEATKRAIKIDRRLHDS